MTTSPSLFGPPRPCAIATILNCEDTESLSSMQTLLHSIKATNNNHDENTTDENTNNDENIYKPEIITLVTGNISNEIRDEMLGCFCTRIIDIDNINAGNNNNNDYATNDNATSNNANLDVAKIHLFNQKVYEKILYIDSNCLVQKSVSHLFKLSNDNSSNNSDNNNNDNDNLGLIAANNNDNNDNYDNNQGFGSNVILIQPSNELYKDMMNQVHANLSTNQSTADFWNTYFHNTWNQIPKENKLGIEYNYYNNNNNSDLKHEDICIWNYNHDNNNNHSASISTRNKLYQKWYKKSQRYKENYREEQLLTQKAKHDSQLQQLKRKRQQKQMAQQLHQQQGATNNNHNNNPNETKKKQMEKHKLVTKRYKELRKEGKDPKESMRIARSDYGMDKDDERQQSPSAQVAKMFGMGGIV